MAAISPFNFLAVLDGKAQAPELISPDQTIPAFEDALASMLGSQAENANGSENTEAPTAAPTLGLPTGIRLTLDPPLNGVPSGAETDGETPIFGLISAEAAIHDSAPDEAADEEPVDDEALLVNPQACFVTLPWLPPADREEALAVGSSPAQNAASVEPLALPIAKNSAPTVDTKPVHDAARRSTLRFPPPPPEAILQATRELASVQAAASGKPSETSEPAQKKYFGGAPQARGTQEAPTAPEPRSTPRVLEPGFVVAPSFVEGGRIEWTIALPAAPANDTHRSMSYAVAAAEHEQRTFRAEPKMSSRRERSAAVAAAEPREAIDRSEPVREIAASAEVAKVTDTVTAAAPEAQTFMGQAQPIRSEAVVEPRALASAALQPDLRSEASRERRQDDAEVTVSQMTLSHRVEARTVVDDLGAITVRADARDGRVDVSVTADRVETTAFLDQNRADLTRDLKISAPSVSDVSMRTGDSGSGSRREQHAQRQANDDWAAGTPSSMAAASGDARTLSANGKRVRIVL